MYGRPPLVFMDEPNSERSGERARSAVQTLKAEGSTVVMLASLCDFTAHDLILVLSKGKVADFGAAQDVLSRLKSGSNQHSATAHESNATSPAVVTTVPVKS